MAIQDIIISAPVERIAWESSLDEAQRQSGVGRKAVLVSFSAAPQCQGCVAMESITYCDPIVEEFIVRHFLPVRLSIAGNELGDEFLIIWTPTVLLLDGHRRVHCRIEGYLPPREFTARLSLGLGRFYLDHGSIHKALERFAEVSQRHKGEDAGAEAEYWLGVARFKETGNVGELLSAWQELYANYPESEWTKRTQFPR